MSQKRKLLLITESSEGQNFKKFFPDWDVKTIMTGGHIKKLNEDDPVDWKTMSPKLIWIPKPTSGKYKDYPSKKEIMKKINNIGSTVDEIWLLLDQDYSGHNISQCVYDELTSSNKKKAIRRCMNDWSKDSIQKNIIDNNKPDVLNHKFNGELSWLKSNNAHIDTWKVAADQFRQCLDILLGFSLSNYIRRKISGSRSVGRVQTPSLLILLEREEHIKNFKEQKSYGMNYIIHTDKPMQDLQIDLIELNPNFKPKPNMFFGEEEENKKQISKIIKFNSKQDLENYVKTYINKNEFKLESFNKSETTQNPPMLFETNTFCQYASTHFGYKVKDIMEMLQKLYEAGKISYTRTDSTKAEPAFCKKAIEFLKKDKNIAKDLNIIDPEDYYFQKAQKGSQEGHFFLGPVDLSLTPEKAKKEIAEIKSKYDSSKLQKIYDALYFRTKIAFFKASKADSYKLIFNNNDSKFQGSFSNQTYAGWKQFVQDLEEVEQSKLSPEPYKVNNIYQASNFDKPTSFKAYITKNKGPLTMAGLLAILKKNGVGRPSYYRQMTSLLEERGYMEEKKKHLFLTDLGRKVAIEARTNLNSLINLTYSRQLNEIMDDIGIGKNIYSTEMAKFLKTLNACLTKNGLPEWNEKTSSQKSSSDKKPVELTNLKCPVCGKPLKKMSGQYGQYFACSGYPKCKYTQKSDKQAKTFKCPKCGKTMIEFEWKDKKTGETRHSKKCLNSKCKYVEW